MRRQPPTTSMVTLFFYICLAVFVLFPGIDLVVSARFYSDGGFFYNQQGWPYVVHKVIPIVGTVLLIGLPVVIVASIVVKPLAPARRLCVFLMLSLMTGPVLVTNVVLKEHVGRPRPVDVQEFGGRNAFATVFEKSNACQRNCSFVSGHAALGFFPCVLYVFYRRRAWMVAGLASGGLVAAARVMAGKHFASDVIFAFFVVYASAVLVAALLRALEAAAASRSLTPWSPTPSTA